MYTIAITGAIVEIFVDFENLIITKIMWVIKSIYNVSVLLSCYTINKKVLNHSHKIIVATSFRYEIRCEFVTTRTGSPPIS